MPSPPRPAQPQPQRVETPTPVVIVPGTVAAAPPEMVGWFRVRQGIHQEWDGKIYSKDDGPFQSPVDLVKVHGGDKFEAAEEPRGRRASLGGPPSQPGLPEHTNPDSPEHRHPHPNQPHNADDASQDAGGALARKQAGQPQTRQTHDDGTEE